jgi:2-keto-4-pentenoate hydratase
VNENAIREAATTLWTHWQQGRRLSQLPPGCRPCDRPEGYAVQAELARLSGQPVAGWKIAATSVAGQQHIGVDGPLAGRLLANRLLAPGADISLATNRMRVAEVEFAFRMRESLPPRERAWALDEVMAAVDTLQPAIEVPDSRYEDFARVGAPQLIADCACACWLVVGAPFGDAWRAADLSARAVSARVNGAVAATGSGANVLGDPRVALAWIANELRVHAGGLRAGDLVTTGTCVVPVTVAPGDRVVADYGAFGSLDVSFRAE